MKNPTLQKVFRVTAIILGSLVALAAIVALAIYFWPHQNSYLQTGTPNTISFDQATRDHAAIVAQEVKEGVTDECTSDLYTHGKRTTKSVVMFHGVTACPKQFEGLAQVFFDAGYNVYVPRTPHHGLPDKKRHGEVRANELVDYVNQSVTLATGLGDELGAVGLSGGGMLTTWAAEYRPEVTRALVMSPFYEPAAAQAPKWQLPFLNMLYGYHIVPDQFSVPSDPDGAAFSYRALANYNLVTKNLKSNPKDLSLKNLAVVISDDDDQIDLDLARTIPRTIADSNPDMNFIEVNTPAEWKLGHDIVSLDNTYVAARSSQLFTMYLDAYEGRKTNL